MKSALGGPGLRKPLAVFKPAQARPVYSLQGIDLTLLVLGVFGTGVVVGGSGVLLLVSLGMRHA